MSWVRVLPLVAVLFAGVTAQAAEQENRPPNFLVIVADDLGWSDIGVLGGEIRTPSIDRLAEDGTLVTSFYVAPTCAPTRAMLMTGVDHHEAGLGVQSGLRAPNQVGINYEGQLHDGVVTVAEALAARGYQTFMTGKWHLANEDAQGPHNRGFQRSFVLLTGGASHFADQRPIAPVEIPEYVRDGAPVDELPADFFSSTAYADTLLEYLGGARGRRAVLRLSRFHRAPRSAARSRRVARPLQRRLRGRPGRDAAGAGPSPGGPGAHPRRARGSGTIPGSRAGSRTTRRPGPSARRNSA